ncbi:hypothetical protein LCGC14_0867830 [marine sediment metagenome]|uniref:Uncharacterized protein n=1 Tax=marine sediment metagenome TaxID=412755 RepID=A0A0F9SCM0_9ZZZZ
MNPDIERYEEQRKKHFWEFCIITILLVVFLAGCESTSYEPGIPQPYNLTLMGNATGIVSLTQLVNDQLMDGYFGIGLLVTIFMITFGAFMVSTGHSGKAFAASSFIMFAMSLLLMALDLVPDYVMYAAIGIAGLSVAFLGSKD